MNKRARIFELFDAGCSPSSPEVKGLKLKAQTRANYFWEWKKERGEANTGKAGKASISAKLPGGETIGSIDESKQPKQEPPPPPKSEETISQEILKEESGEEGEEAGPVEEVEPEGAKSEKSRVAEESISGVSEAGKEKGADGKPGAREIKIATTIADDGIKCTVFLSLKTLALFKIASSTQSQADGGQALLLGDFIDTCVADYFSGRGKELGLLNTGGQKR